MCKNTDGGSIPEEREREAREKEREHAEKEEETDKEALILKSNHYRGNSK